MTHPASDPLAAELRALLQTQHAPDDSRASEIIRAATLERPLGARDWQAPLAAAAAVVVVGGGGAFAATHFGGGGHSSQPSGGGPYAACSPASAQQSPTSPDFSVVPSTGSTHVPPIVRTTTASAGGQPTRSSTAQPTTSASEQPTSSSSARPTLPTTAPPRTPTAAPTAPASSAPPRSHPSLSAIPCPSPSRAPESSAAPVSSTPAAPTSPDFTRAPSIDQLIARCALPTRHRITTYDGLSYADGKHQAAVRHARLVVRAQGKHCLGRATVFIPNAVDVVVQNGRIVYAAAEH